eukprot:scaffold137478_cov32-Tisochrysis_lutea.AAC.2
MKAAGDSHADQPTYPLEARGVWPWSCVRTDSKNDRGVQYVMQSRIAWRAPRASMTPRTTALFPPPDGPECVGRVISSAAEEEVRAPRQAASRADRSPPRALARMRARRGCHRPPSPALAPRVSRQASSRPPGLAPCSVSGVSECVNEFYSTLSSVVSWGESQSRCPPDLTHLSYALLTHATTVRFYPRAHLPLSYVMVARSPSSTQCLPRRPRIILHLSSGR